ncbi:MAG: polyketide cyclase [Citricoccus sp.]|nr:polyketide cyclase [Citricoccus sp. WCRC_4]
MVDIQSQLAAVTRGIHTEDREGEPSYVQTLEQAYPASIDDVWEAVTTADRIRRWFLPVTGELEPGGRYQLQGNAGGEVLECAPPTAGRASYRITWEFGGGVSWVTVRLAADGEQTRLELEHVARVADMPAGMWETYGPGATGVGWDGGLLGLALHLNATEGSLSPGEAEAWALTDEGRSFYRGAADGWASAHVAAGADPGDAAKNADATYGFYTGAGM